VKAIALEDFGTPEVFYEADIPRPVPLPSEVLVRVHAVGLNPVDWKTRQGLPTPARVSMGSGPHVLGWEVSGVVEAVGPGVHLFGPGDEVYGLPWFPRPGSAYAEFVTAPSRQFAAKPANVDHVHAAAIPLAGLTAWHALTEVARVEAGQRVLVHAAAGGVGHLAVQLARHLGAYVIGTASESKHDFLRTLGVNEVIDYRTTRFEEAVAPVDVVLDLVGDRQDSTTTRSLEVLKPDGIVVRIAPGSDDGLPAAAARRGLRVSRDILVEPDGCGLKHLATLVEAGELVVHVEQAFSLDQVADAHRRGESNGVTGKLVLTVS
jgi:NADPH:quinone reductase-like Zn-dependent oxidoreductase